ncbi:MAG TPA: DUF2520 domain-containing protein [Dehalococcoidia bacterium]|nr:DUF2520 domain-containing protein [Dehalococcoidia bacterium]
MSRPRVGFVGTGKVGTALGAGIQAAGYPVVAGWSRSTPALTRFLSRVPGAAAASRPLDVVEAADLVFLTVPDSLIPVLAASLSWDSTKIAVHCSGALSLDVLEPATAEGAAVGSLHPLLALASAEADFRGATAALEGDERALPVLEQIAADLELRALVLAPGQKALYHAAAVILSNYSVILFAVAQEILESLGEGEEEARASLLPLLRAVVTNLGRQSAPAALTGPIARGDVQTVAGHLAALAAKHPELIPLYQELGLKTVDLANRQGSIDEDIATELRQLLMAKQIEEVPV